MQDSTFLCFGDKMIIEQENKQWIERVLTHLPFVQWDRFLNINAVDIRIISIFGWIDRKKDNYKDFVHLKFNLITQKVCFLGTSSKEYSKKISAILGSQHIDCQRVKENFEVLNAF